MGRVAAGVFAIPGAGNLIKYVGKGGKYVLRGGKAAYEAAQATQTGTKIAGALGRRAERELAEEGAERLAAGGAARALPGARQIEAAWGASTYRHGGLMTGMEHIMYRHSAGSGFANVSRYAQGTTARNIVGYVDDALRYGTVSPNGPGAYMVEHNLGRAIGTNIAGEAASSIRVFVRDGVIQTAFPF